MGEFNQPNELECQDTILVLQSYILFDKIIAFTANRTRHPHQSLHRQHHHSHHRDRHYHITRRVRPLMTSL